MRNWVRQLDARQRNARLVVGCLFLSLGLFMGELRSFAESVEAMISRGLDLREDGRDREALEVFRKAYEVSKSARALAQMALAKQALGEWVDAERDLAAALATKDPWIKSNQSALDQALVKIRTRLGRLEISGSPVGAELLVNGKRHGVLPLAEPISVVAGTVVLEIRAEAHHPISRTLDVSPGGLSRERFDLIPIKIAAPSPSLPTPSSKEAASPAVIGSAPPPQTKANTPAAPSATLKLDREGAPPQEGDDNTLQVAAFSSAGVATLGVAAGVIGLIMRNSKVSEYNDDTLCLRDGRTRDENCGEILSSANSAGTLSTIGFIVGGASAIVTTVLFVLAGEDSDPEMTSAAAKSQNSGITFLPGAGPGTAGIGCDIRF